jgi:transcription elongation factor Elf1
MLPLVDIQCPYCGEQIVVAVDDSAGEQSYVEDCQVCCRPIEIAVRFDADGASTVTARAEDEA